MPNKTTCLTCKGAGSIDALISQHDDRTESMTCPRCLGRGSLYNMTQDEEDDYHADYW